MDELIKNTEIITVEQQSPASQIMAICRVLTPQFYKGLSKADIKAEKETIELLTKHIDSLVIAKMCELAIKSYGTARSDNKHVYFDVNYVLSFYREAFNDTFCTNIKLPSNAERVGDEYDPESRIISEYWCGKDKKRYTVKYIADVMYNEYLRNANGIVRHYTPKYYEMQDNYWNENVEKFLT